jgi:hypothetical protein
MNPGIAESVRPDESSDGRGLAGRDQWSDEATVHYTVR